MGKVPLKDIPNKIDLVWHGANDPLNLDFFIKSPVPWGEGDLRQGEKGDLILRHDGFDTHPLREGEPLLLFDEWIRRLQSNGKKIQIDLKEGGEMIKKMVSLLKTYHLEESELWMTTNLKDVSIDDLSRLKEILPRSLLQSTVPLRFMFQEMSRQERREWLDLNRGMGVKRLSICWYDSPTREELSEIKESGFEINLYNVNSLHDFQEAIGFDPESITSDFHLPEWNLFGRGSGENGFYLEPAIA